MNKNEAYRVKNAANIWLFTSDLNNLFCSALLIHCRERRHADDLLSDRAKNGAFSRKIFLQKTAFEPCQTRPLTIFTPALVWPLVPGVHHAKFILTASFFSTDLPKKSEGIFLTIQQVNFKVIAT